MRAATAPLQTTITTSSLLQIPPPPRTCKTHLHPPSSGRISFPRTTSRRRTTTIITARPQADSAPETVSSTEEVISTAEDVVRGFYNGINRRDLTSIAPLIAEDCVYEDLIFSTPFVGRKVILEFFRKFMGSISSDFKFCIDNISGGDSSAVGLTWHLEWQGKAFPFSRGCSFYRVDLRDGNKQIVYGRDCVEPAIKPGETTLVIIQGVAWILQRFPQLVKLI